MDRYQRVEKPREEMPFKEDEIRVTIQGKMPGYINYATILIKKKELNKIVFKAMGRAINKTVLIVELLKKRISGLHQNTAISSTDVIDAWEPLEEGLLPLETIRHVSTITITLSKQELDMSSVGYQTPLRAGQVKPKAEYEDGGERYPAGRAKGRGNRRRGSGKENGAVVAYNVKQEASNGHLEEPQAPLKGRGRQRRRVKNQGMGQDAKSNGPINAGPTEALSVNGDKPS